VNRSENAEVRQSSRIVTAARRQTVAQEKARITGERARQPSALEQAAVEWEKEREASARNLEEERFRVPRDIEMCPFSPQQVLLRDDGTEPPPEDDTSWKPYSPQQEKRAATTVTDRVNMAGVCGLSRRLIALERARALGRKPVDVGAWALELEARRWTEERATRSGVR